MTLTRTATIDASRADGDEDMTFALSSEAPYKRYDGIEILVHETEAVDLTWLKSGNAPLLDTHDRYGLSAQLGIITDAWLEEKRLYVTVKFRSDERSQSIARDIENGTIRNVSVGYEVIKTERDEDAEEYRVIKWRPKEASFVPLPADETVGMGRSIQAKQEGTMPEHTTKLRAPSPEDALTDEQRAEALEAAINEISALAAEHNLADMGRAFIKNAVSRGETPSIALFRGVVRANIPEDKPLHNTDIGLTDRDSQQFSIVRWAASERDGATGAEIEAAAFEREAIAAAGATMSKNAHVALPTDLMRHWGDFEINGVNIRSLNGRQYRQEIRAALATSGNPNILTTDHRSQNFIDSLRDAMVLGRLGVTMLPGLSSDVDIPGKDTDTVAAWLAAEDDDVAESTPTFRIVQLEPKDLGAYTDLTRRMIQQSTIGIEALVRQDIVMGIAQEADRAGFYGTNSNGQPEGIANVSGIGSKTFSAAVPTRDELIDMVKEVRATNQMANLDFVMDTDMEADLKKEAIDAGSGRFLMGNNGQLEIGYPTAVTNALTSGDVFLGHFPDMLMGLWGGLELARSTEAKFLSGGIRLRAIQTLDFGYRRVGSFALGNDTP
jgi:HK97 family phage major capsid protein